MNTPKRQTVTHPSLNHIVSDLIWSDVQKYYVRDSTARFYIARTMQGDSVFGYHA